MSTPALRFTYDRAANAAYVALQPASVMQPSVSTTLPANGWINLDFNDNGELVGVEVLDARDTLADDILRQGTVDVGEWALLLNALNEILYGLEAIEEREFDTRTGWRRDDAVDLLHRLRGGP